MSMLREHVVAQHLPHESHPLGNVDGIVDLCLETRDHIVNTVLDKSLVVLHRGGVGATSPEPAAVRVLLQVTNTIETVAGGVATGVVV